MTTLFTICAVVGGTLFVCQFLLTLLGVGGDHDIAIDAGGHDVHIGHDVHHDSSWFFGVLSFRAIVAAVTVFGLAGRAALAAQMSTYLSLLIAGASAFAAMLLIAALMQGLTKLQSEGTIHIEGAVGQPGTVYLKIPGNRAGLGKVTLNLQDRTVEYQA